MARCKRYNELVFLEILNGDIMEIKLKIDGPWIVELWKDGELLNKKDADNVWSWILDWANTCQYPEDKENIKW